MCVEWKPLLKWEGFTFQTPPSIFDNWNPGDAWSRAICGLGNAELFYTKTFLEHGSFWTMEVQSMKALQLHYSH